MEPNSDGLLVKKINHWATRHDIQKRVVNWIWINTDSEKLFCKNRIDLVNLIKKRSFSRLGDIPPMSIYLMSSIIQWILNLNTFSPSPWPLRPNGPQEHSFITLDPLFFLIFRTCQTNFFPKCYKINVNIYNYLHLLLRKVWKGACGPHIVPIILHSFILFQLLRCIVVYIFCTKTHTVFMFDILA